MRYTETPQDIVDLCWEYHHTCINTRITVKQRRYLKTLKIRVWKLIKNWWNWDIYIYRCRINDRFSLLIRTTTRYWDRNPFFFFLPNPYQRKNQTQTLVIKSIIWSVESVWIEREGEETIRMTRHGRRSRELEREFERLGETDEVNSVRLYLSHCTHTYIRRMNGCDWD